jgi:hypothetical protein
VIGNGAALRVLRNPVGVAVEPWPAPTRVSTPWMLGFYAVTQAQKARDRRHVCKSGRDSSVLIPFQFLGIVLFAMAIRA